METNYKIAYRALSEWKEHLRPAKRGLDYRYTYKAVNYTVCLDFSDLKRDNWLQSQILDLYNVLVEAGKIKEWTKTNIIIGKNDYFVEDDNVQELTEILLKNKIEFQIREL